MSNGVFGQRNGNVFIRDFDLGVVLTLGGELNNAGTQYFLTVGTAPDTFDVPIVFVYPGQVFFDYLLPGITVRRDDISFAMNRWMYNQMEYRVAAEGASLLPVDNDIGFDAYETKEMAKPADITYTISLYSAYRNQLNEMVKKILAVLAPRCNITVTDSLGIERLYHGEVDSMSGLDDVVSVADRQVGYSFSLKVEGELDLTDGITIESDIITTRRVNVTEKT